MGLDGVLICLVGLAAADFLLIAIAGTAGPYGFMVLPAVGLLALAAPLLLVRLVVSTRGRAPGRSGFWLLLVVLVALPLSIGAIPAREQFDRWSDRRDERRVSAMLNERAASCAATAARRYPDEPETNPGVSVRPLLTEAMIQCMQGPVGDWTLTCGSACEARPPVDRGGARVLLVYLDGYMDVALRRAGHGPWNRSPQPGYRLPPKPWVVPAD